MRQCDLARPVVFGAAAVPEPPSTGAAPRLLATFGRQRGRVPRRCVGESMASLAKLLASGAPVEKKVANHISFAPRRKLNPKIDHV
jgi:hypothetical protein